MTADITVSQPTDHDQQVPHKVDNYTFNVHFSLTIWTFFRG